MPRSILSVGAGVIAFGVAGAVLWIGLAAALGFADLIPAAYGWLPFPVFAGAALTAGGVAATIARSAHRRVGAAAAGMGIAATWMLGDMSPTVEFDDVVYLTVIFLISVGAGAALGAAGATWFRAKPRDLQ